jgi:hypothetical protein
MINKVQRKLSGNYKLCYVLCCSLPDLRASRRPALAIAKEYRLTGVGCFFTKLS